MTHDEYMRLTDSRAIRVACGAITDVIAHQPPARKELCQVILNALQAWGEELRTGIVIDAKVKEAPSDAH